MKVAIFHELPFGGARDAVYYFGEGLKKNRIVADLYYVSDKKDERIASFFRTINFYKFVPKKWSGNNWRARLYKDSIELYILRNLHKKIAKKIDANNYDIVLVNGSQYIEAPFILQYLSIFKIFYCHDPNYRIIYEKTLNVNFMKINILKKFYEKTNRYIRKYLDKSNFNKANLILANSLFSKKIIKKTYDRNSSVIYPGVDIDYFSPVANKKDIDIFYIGSYQKIDGYDLLKSSLISLPKNIVIEKKMYEDGWIADKDVIRDFYRRAKIVVCLAINEPFGSVPLEAMSCGIPVIAVNKGGHLETIVNNETGYLINRNSHELSSRIKELLNDDIKLNKMGNKAREHVVKNWSWEKRSKLLSNYLKETKKNNS